MIDYFLTWLNNSLNVSDDLLFVFGAVSALFIMNFLLDFFRFIMYYITRK